MTERLHTLSRVNPQTRRATCANCGRVNVHIGNTSQKTGTVTYRCAIASKAKKARQTARDTPATRRRAQLRFHYKITPEDYQEMLDAQNGVCAICGDPPLDTRVLGVDHDHATGKVRGLLCIPCNRALGYMRDRPDLLRQAAKYLGGKK